MAAMGCGDLGFEVGEAPVLEAQGGAGGLQAFIKGVVVYGELAYALLEGGVLADDALDRVLGPFGLQVPDLAEERGDAGALAQHLRVRGLQPVFGIACTFPPRRLTFGVLGVQLACPALPSVLDGKLREVMANSGAAAGFSRLGPTTAASSARMATELTSRA